MRALLAKRVAKLMLALCTASLASVADAQPVKRQIVLDVMAKRDLRVTRTERGKTIVMQESTGTVALDFKGLRSAMKTIVVQGSKHETTIMQDYGNFNTTLTETFFNERVCFKQTLLKVRGETPQRMFESAAVDALHYEYYNRSEFGGFAPSAGGQLAEYWAFNKTLTLHSKVHFPDGQVYDMRSKVNQTYSYLIAAPPAIPTILRYALFNSVYDTFHPTKAGQRPRDPIAFTTLAHLDYSEVVSPARRAPFCRAPSLRHATTSSRIMTQTANLGVMRLRSRSWRAAWRFPSCIGRSKPSIAAAAAATHRTACRTTHSMPRLGTARGFPSHLFSAGPPSIAVPHQKPYRKLPAPRRGRPPKRPMRSQPHSTCAPRGPNALLWWGTSATRASAAAAGRSPPPR